MFPRILEFELFGASLGVNSYGLMAAVGYLLAVFVAYRQAVRLEMNSDAMLDLYFWILVSSLVGSRVMYVLANLDRFSRNWLSVFYVWEGGLVFYGGLICALLTGIAVVRMKNLGYMRAADVISPVLALGHAFGRIGCYAVGCCFGKVMHSSWGARFGPSSVAFQEMVRLKAMPPSARTTPPLHPVQLYEAAAEVVVFIVILHLGRRKPFHGFLILSYLFMYSCLRFITEIFRGDATRKFIWTLSTPSFNKMLGLDPLAPCFLSTSQLVSLLLLPASAAAIWLLYGRSKKARSST